MQEVSAALNARYGPAARGFMEETALMKRSQGMEESVQDYAEDIANRMSLVGVQEPQRWKYFVKGLKKDLRSYVIEKEPANLEEAEKYAKKAEQLDELKTEDEDKVAQIAKAVEQSSAKVMEKVIAALDRMSDRTVAAVTQRDNLWSPQAPQMDQRQQRQLPTQGQQGRPFCSICGRAHTSGLCQKQCWSCGRYGHLKSMCRNRTGQRGYNQNFSQKRNQGQNWGTQQFGNLQTYNQFNPGQSANFYSQNQQQRGSKSQNPFVQGN